MNSTGLPSCRGEAPAVCSRVTFVHRTAWYVQVCTSTHYHVPCAPTTSCLLPARRDGVMVGRGEKSRVHGEPTRMGS